VAANSQREQIILAVVAALGTLEDVKSVVRRRPTLEQLQSIAQTELPKVAVTAGLPVPDPHLNERQRTRLRDKFLSNLEVEVVLYDFLYDDDAYDSRVSSLADDLWVLLNANQGWNGLARSTVVQPEADVVVWDPYLAFKVTLTIQYIHGIGGI
jgi:hypothetical protein